MSKSVPQLNDPRAARDRARAEFKRRLGLAKADLAPAVLKRRVMAEAQRTGMSVANQAIDIANDNRGVVAATVAALVLWLTRKPIMAGGRQLVGRFGRRKSLPQRLSDRFKRVTDDYWHRLKEYADD